MWAVVVEIDHMAMESVAEEILLRLPTRDVGRGRCVSQQWRGLLTDPYFIGLHAHAGHVVPGAAAEALLVSKTQTLGCSPEMTVFNASTAATMCVVAGLADGYSPTNACNGFLLLAANTVRWMPALVCNPVTGDKLRVLPPLPSGTDSGAHCHLHAMGYSPSTRQYKLFRLSLSAHDGRHQNYIHVLTLGGADGDMWRRHRGLYRCHRMGATPALIDHKLHVLCMKREHDTKPNRLLVVDMASETHRMYCLPGYNAEDAVASVLDLHGRLCVAVHELGPCRGKLYFWVVRPQAPHGCLYPSPLIWEMRYSFNMGATSDYMNRWHAVTPSCAWLDDDDGMLYYLYGDRVYKHDTKKGRRRQGCRKAWDHKLQLLLPNNRWWNVFSGYRPNLLSPHDLAIAPQQEEERFEHRVLHALRCHKSSKNCGDSPQIDDGQPAAKLQSQSWMLPIK